MRITFILTILITILDSEVGLASCNYGASLDACHITELSQAFLNTPGPDSPQQVCAYNNQTNELKDRELAMGLGAADRIHRWQKQYLGFMQGMLVQAEILGVAPEKLSQSKCANDVVVREATNEQRSGCSGRWSEIQRLMNNAREKVSGERSLEISRLMEFMFPENKSCLSDSEANFAEGISNRAPTIVLSTNQSLQRRTGVSLAGLNRRPIVDGLAPENRASNYRSAANQIALVTTNLSCPISDFHEVFASLNFFHASGDGVINTEVIQTSIGQLYALTRTNDSSSCRQFLDLLNHIKSSYEDLAQGYSNSDIDERERSLNAASETSGERLETIYKAEGKRHFLARINRTCNQLKEELSDLVCTTNPEEFLQEPSIRGLSPSSNREDNRRYVEALYQTFFPGSCSPVDDNQIAHRMLERFTVSSDGSNSNFLDRRAEINQRFCAGYLHWKEDCSSGECSGKRPEGCSTSSTVDDYCSSSSSSHENGEPSLCELRALARANMPTPSPGISRGAQVYYDWVDRLATMGSISSSRASFASTTPSIGANRGNSSNSNRSTATTNASSTSNIASSTVPRFTTNTPTTPFPTIITPVPQAPSNVAAQSAQEAATGENIEVNPIARETATEDAATIALRDRIARLEGQIAAAEAAANAPSVTNRSPASVSDVEVDDPDTESTTEEVPVAAQPNALPPRSNRGSEGRGVSLQSGDDTQMANSPSANISPQVTAAAPPLGFDLGNSINENSSVIGSYNNQARNAALNLPRLSLNVSGVSVLSEAGSAENLVAIDAPPATVLDVNGVTDYIKSKVDPALVRNGPVIIQLGESGSLWKVTLVAGGELQVTPVPRAQVAQVQRVFRNNLMRVLASVRSN